MNEATQLEAELKSAIPEIMARVRRESESRIETECRAAVMAVAVAEASEWAKTVLAPEIRAQLEIGKGAMVAKAEGIAAQLADALADGLTDQVRKTLANNYSVKQVVEALFKGY